MGKLRYPAQIFLLLILAAAPAAACILPTQIQATPTPTGAANVPVLPLVGGIGGGPSGGGNSSGPGNGSSSGGNGSNNPANPPEPTPQDTPDTVVFYDVKQVITLGGESLSGMVCSITDPFQVLSTTPNVTFNFVFVPSGPDKGSWTYAYNIPKAGESHDASGAYTLSRPDDNGTLHLTMSGKDHVVFKGFDGKMPISYKFDLVPSQKAKCLP